MSPETRISFYSVSFRLSSGKNSKPAIALRITGPLLEQILSLAEKATNHEMPDFVSTWESSPMITKSIPSPKDELYSEGATAVISN
jgi:hypothetical protein